MRLGLGLSQQLVRPFRSMTVAEGASIAARERVWFALTEDLVADINRRVDSQVGRYFAPYLVRG